MSFAQAQARWEQSWIYGPPDDPADDPQAMEYMDSLARMTDDELHLELANVRAALRSPSKCCKVENLRASEVWIEEEIRVRDEETVNA